MPKGLGLHSGRRGMCGVCDHFYRNLKSNAVEFFTLRETDIKGQHFILVALSLLILTTTT